MFLGNVSKFRRFEKILRLFESTKFAAMLQNFGTISDYGRGPVAVHAFVMNTYYVRFLFF